MRGNPLTIPACPLVARGPLRGEAAPGRSRDLLGMRNSRPDATGRSEVAEFVQIVLPGALDHVPCSFAVRLGTEIATIY